MEAISVIFDPDLAPIDATVLARMQAAVPHRGAASAAHVDPGLAMAKRCVGTPGDCGIVRSANGCTVAFGGILYNRADVEQSLPDRVRPTAGAPSMRDEDAVLGAYEAWGVDCFSRLDGDFALALYDPARGELHCACDAIGVKPLFFARQGRRFLAASEPKQLLAAGVPPEPCEEKLASYLSLAPHLCGGPTSFYRAITRLEAGHFVTVGRAPGPVRPRRYWTLDPNKQIAERDPRDVSQRVRDLMINAVRRRVAARAPYGCALSGGFDSSTIAALLRRELSSRGLSDPIESFAFLLRDDTADESDIIESVAQSVGARRHDVYVDVSGVLDVMPQMIRALDGPVIDLGVMLLWKKKERVASAGVSCVLSGLGGDELFMGRLHYFADLVRAGRLPSLYREVRACYPIDPSTSKRTSLRNLLMNYAILPLFPRGAKKTVRRLLMGERLVGPWIEPAFAARNDLEARVRAAPPQVYRDRYRQDCWETFQYCLVGETLPVHEALGAAFAVDTRFPLMDRALVEYMFAVPREMKVARGRSRIVQREAMAGIIPEVVLQEHIKKDFHPALVRQQRRHFEKAMADVLSRRDFRSAPYVNWPHLREQYPRYLAGGAKDWFPLLYALSIEQWLESLSAPPVQPSPVALGAPAA